MPRYKVILLNSQNATLTPVADITRIAKGLKWSAQRRSYEEISFTINAPDLVSFCKKAGLDGSQIFEAKKYDIHLYRDGIPLPFGARIIRAPLDLNKDNSTLQVDARGYLDLLNDKKITKSYSGVDACAISRDIISTKQVKQYGNMGITFGNTFTLGVSTDRTYVRKNAMEAIQQLSDDASGGFDMWFDHNRKYYTAADMGSFKGDRTYKYPGNVNSYLNPNDGSNLANEIEIIGSGIGNEAKTSIALDDTSAIEYGLHEKTFVYSSLETQSVIDARAQTEKENRKLLYNLPRITIPSKYFNPNETWIGDRIPIQVKHPLVNRIDVQRIERIECSVDDNHQETFTLILDRQGVEESA